MSNTTNLSMYKYIRPFIFSIISDVMKNNPSATTDECFHHIWNSSSFQDANNNGVDSIYKPDQLKTMCYSLISEYTKKYLSSNIKPGYLIAILGPSASGKDTIGKYLYSHTNLEWILQGTTRCRRPDEESNDHYKFIDNPEFTKLLNEGKILEHKEYPVIENGQSVMRNYFTFVPDPELFANTSMIGVFNPTQYIKIRNSGIIPIENIIPVYIACDDHVRLLRSIKRAGNNKDHLKSACLRYLEDPNNPYFEPDALENSLHITNECTFNNTDMPLDIISSDIIQYINRQIIKSKGEK